MIDLFPFTEDDIDRLIGWIRSEDELLHWTASSFGFPLTREHILQHMKESAAKTDRLIFKAVETETGEVRGHIELGAIDRRNSSLRIGRVLIDPDAQGRGFGAAMMRKALAIAFDQLGMHRVELSVFDVNPRAIALYERVGFQRDGMRREAFKVRDGPGGYWGDIIMSVLAAEWAG
jgi:RimJ/RimL family protein N-acetyltransferase